jgi:hypothetical protein
MGRSLLLLAIALCAILGQCPTLAATSELQIRPRVGRAHWKLRSQEGRLFHAGPEEVREVRGDSYFWEVGVARQVSNVVTLGVNYKQGQYDFGRTRSTAFTVTLGF